jgi:Rrf2 family transcriptional regulator, iron-sulfur cluster assembly transcription factor
VKLSSKGRYAVRALFDIAFYNDGQPTQVKEIAERQAIPPRFLEQIFQDLKRAGIVGSKRGPQGGYLLARPTADIRLGDVIQVIEGEIALGEEESKGPPAKLRKPEVAQDGQRVTNRVLEQLSGRVSACLNEVSLSDVCDLAERLGIKKLGLNEQGESQSVYFI